MQLGLQENKVQQQGVGARFPGRLKLVVAATLLLTATGCETLQTGKERLKDVFASGDPCANNARNIGIAAGSIAGAVAGQVIGGDSLGVVVGAGAGALVGGLIGWDIDRRRCELHKIAQQYELEMEVESLRVGSTAAQPGGHGLSVSVRENAAQFAVGSGQLTQSGIETFRAVADAYRTSETNETPQDTAQRMKKMRLLLVGHTDDTGTSALNAQLSEQRAKAVAEIFAAKGFDRAQIYYQGAGETLPIANNAEESGRAKNRRVEIIDLSDDQAFSNYLSGGRRPNLAFYREAVAETQPPAQKRAAVAKAEKRGAAPSTAPRSETTARNQESASSLPTPAVAVTKAAEKNAQDVGVAYAHVRALPGWDFGGAPVNGKPAVLALGAVKKPGVFSLLPLAQASDTAPLLSCLQDRPRVANEVKSLKTGKARTSDYFPGAYGGSWVAQVNGHLVALNNVKVLREGAVPSETPELLIYRNYQGNAQAKPDHKVTPQVNTYLGEKGLLYRVFSSGPVQCMDVLIPHQLTKAALGANLIYPGPGDYYQVEFAPKLAN